MSKRCYTVIGFYPETGQKYAGHHIVSTPSSAEGQAEVNGVIVCGVIEGEHKTLDSSVYINQ